jgi:solute carrier family 8 (sodium/calcium exchanger)
MEKEPLICENGGKGLVLPLIENEADKIPNPVRVILYLLFLLWCFIGVAIISDIFMGAIETITSKKRRVMDKATGRMKTVKAWNDTVANLTLMALGSSAPEILLSVIELFQLQFHSGDLGPSTIVGSAAFNLLAILGVCIIAIPEGEVRRIRDTSVFAVTATFSIFAYLWMIVILTLNTPDIVDIWEGVLTFLFFPILVSLSFAADVGMFSSKEEEKDSKSAVVADMTNEELGELMNNIRQRASIDLSDDKVFQIIEKQALQHRSRAAYRVKATREMVGGRKVTGPNEAAGTNGVTEVEDTMDERMQKEAEGVVVEFADHKYAVLENAGHIDVHVRRTGELDKTVKVHYKSRDGTAKAVEDYEACEGDVVFEPKCEEKIITVKIIDDKAYEDDEEFFLDLSDPRVIGGPADPKSDVKAVLGSVPTAEITIIDDDEPGILVFEHEEIHVKEDSHNKVLNIEVQRKHGSTGRVTCKYQTEDDSAISPLDFEAAEGELVFAEGQSSAVIPVTIKSQGRYERKELFRVMLEEPTGGAKFCEKTDGGQDTNICTVYIEANDTTRNSVDKASKLLKVNLDKAKIGGDNWAEQFEQALWCNGSREEHKEASVSDLVIHYISVPWKLLFALVPPTDFGGGWVCFSTALMMIGVVTGLIGDVANLVGCTMSISAPVTAITFVALGTSLPDTFASKTAAVQDPDADASVGNVTGSNSVNVFLGLGLPWAVGALYWAGEGATDDWVAKYPDIARRYPEGGFAVPAGSLSFSVLVFSSCALVCLCILGVRRRFCGGELGGETKVKYVTGSMCFGLWLTYIGVAAWRFESEAA